MVDAASGRPAGSPTPLGESNWVHGLELVTLDGRLTAVVDDNGGSENEPGPDPLRFYDLATRRRLDGIEGDFAVLRKAQVRGRTVLVTVNGAHPAPGEVAVPAGSLSVWDPVSRRRLALLPGNPPAGAAHPDTSPPAAAGVSLDVGELQGRPIALTGGFDDVVRLWDLDTGRQIAATVPPGHTDEIDMIQVTRAGGRTVAVTRGWDGRTLVWDLATRRRVDEPWPGTYRSLAEIPADRLDDRRVLVVDGVPGVRFRDVVALSADVSPGDERRGWVTRAGDRTVLFGRDGDRVWIRDPVTRADIGVPVRLGRRVAPPLRGHTERVVQILYGRLGDIPIGVTVALGGDIRVWNLLDGRRIGTPLHAPNRLNAVALGQVNGHAVVLAAGRSEQVRMWDLGGAP
ncbi:WD40 repeat domain-containing protein [Microbispora corallina]|uniref:WD40 repeat domain-containing protein n=1 Tax=Microbispora corallina TaxID=83302 RepID=UPI00194F1B50|nr:hypothetical protein [Microbispora corallina]